MRKHLIIALTVCMAALAFSIKSCSDIKKDRNRLSDNQRSLLEDITFYRTKDSLSAASVEQLTFTQGELKRYCGELVETCDQLKIKVKRLQSVSTSATETEYNIETVFRDSLVVRDSIVVDTLRCVTYKDAWLTFVGCTSDGATFDAKIESRDTLITIIHRIPRNFLFLKWGTKAIRQEVVSKNPHSRIVYTQYIKLKK